MLIWITALSGGLGGAVLTLVGQSVKRWWTKPVLFAMFKADEPGCEVETPAKLVNRETNEVIAECQQKYLRLKIENQGRSFAKNVSVCVTHITYTRPGAGKGEFSEEVFELGLSLGQGRTVFNLAPKGHRFVDLVHTEVCHIRNGCSLPPDRVPQAGCQARRHFDFVTSPFRLEDLGFTRGSYHIVVFASAENAASLREEFEFSWDGSLYGLRIGSSSAAS
jgi:hypothetical protein